MSNETSSGWNGPAPIDERDERWKAKAECLGEGSERAQRIAKSAGYPTVLAAMFPERGQLIAPAVTICVACPVAKECLEYALENPSERGVWGGSSFRQRSTIRQSDDPQASVEMHVTELRIGASTRGSAECGTPGGYRRHRREGDIPCQECRNAEAAITREYARRRAQQRRKARKEGKQ